jgi:hypothetical protein
MKFIQTFVVPEEPGRRIDEDPGFWAMIGAEDLGFDIAWLPSDLKLMYDGFSGHQS